MYTHIFIWIFFFTLCARVGNFNMCSWSKWWEREDWSNAGCVLAKGWRWVSLSTGSLARAVILVLFRCLDGRVWSSCQRFLSSISKLNRCRREAFYCQLPDPVALKRKDFRLKFVWLLENIWALPLSSSGPRVSSWDWIHISTVQHPSTHPETMQLLVLQYAACCSDSLLLRRWEGMNMSKGSILVLRVHLGVARC